MNDTSAKKLEIELVGTKVGGWSVEKLLGNGLSAAVFLASHDGRQAAIKLFDKDFLAEILGSDPRTSQLNRIQRELNLRGKHHENLVRVYDGGECPDTGFLFVVMEYLPAQSLFKSLARVPTDKVRSLIRQVASAARFLLEDLDTVHRDIKVDNIAADENFAKATLLDLGVVKPLTKRGDGSDDSGDEFFGTTRYAPPEFLFGQASSTKEAFRAITFYQLGGVLYDLLSRRRLFGDLKRHKLVWAVEHQMPDFGVMTGPEDLVLLCKDCLIKDADSRLRYVTWERFLDEQRQQSRVAGALERIARREETRTCGHAPAQLSNWQSTVAAQDITSRIHRALKRTWHENRLLPRIACHEALPRDGRCFLIAEIESPNPALPLHKVYLGISVSIEDVSTNACEIVYQGIITTKSLSEEDFEGEYNAVLHRGTLGDEMTSRYALALIAAAVDYCQQMNSAAPESHRLPTGFLEI